MTSVPAAILNLPAAEGETHAVNQLIFEPLWFGVIALGLFFALLAVLWFFRNTLALDPHASSHTDADEAGPHSGRGSSH